MAVARLAMAGNIILQICAVTGHIGKTAHQIMRHYLIVNKDMADVTIDMDEKGRDRNLTVSVSKLCSDITGEFDSAGSIVELPRSLLKSSSGSKQKRIGGRL
jgi:hypothetical protein